jgi:Cu+-exporting ATPase
MEHEHCHHQHDKPERNRGRSGISPAGPKLHSDPHFQSYTCPMHPEVLRDAPGSCPICGMALEPVHPAAEEGESAELRDMTRRLRISAALTLPLLWSLLGEAWPAIDPMRLLGHGVASWAQLLFATPVVLWGGAPFFARGWRSVVTRKLNMFTLIALGTGAAWGFSVLATLLPSALPESFRLASGAPRP